MRNGGRGREGKREGGSEVGEGEGGKKRERGREEKRG